MLVGGHVPGRGLVGPVPDALDGALLEADAGLAQRLHQGGQSRVVELAGRGIVLEQVPGNGALPEFVEAGGEAGQGRLQVVANLTIEGGALADQIAAMADEQLQGGPGFVAGRF